MSNSNYSLTGEASQSLAIWQKVGVGLFAVGLYLVTLVFQVKGASETMQLFGGTFPSIYVYAFLAFGTMFIGSIIFTLQDQHFGSKKWVHHTNPLSIASYALAIFGLSILGFAWFGHLFFPKNLGLLLSLGALILSIAFQIFVKYGHTTSGIKNNYTYFNSLSSRGILGWIAGIFLTLFYIQLYLGKDPFPEMVSMFDGLSNVLKGQDANKWFLYGTLYTFVILFLGIKFMVKYRHNRYHLMRTIVVILSQLILAYFIPNIMEALNFNSATTLVDGKEVYQGYYDANPINSWPLNYKAFTPGTLKAQTAEAYQPLGLLYLFWGILMFLIVTPVVTYFVGKRWYCSWFCGCGGLAETGGDAFRHLSNKSVKAWKIERWLIHGVLVFVTLMTVAVLWPFFAKKEFSISMINVNTDVFFFTVTAIVFLAGFFLIRIQAKRSSKHNMLNLGLIILLVFELFLVMAYFGGTKEAFMIKSSQLKSVYGFFVGSTFSGIIGVGFYPILGNRVWCRFGCPMAGYMGIIQRFKSRFRITTNGGQCISCGNCSTYCEQGIDVRAYAQKGQNIVRASCVGCGVCSAVCPRGVLKLENGPEENRIQENPNLLGLLRDEQPQ